MKKWNKRCLELLGETSQYAKNEFLRRLQVCHREIKWEGNTEDIPKANIGVTYIVGEVEYHEPMKFMKSLEREGIVSQLV